MLTLAILNTCWLFFAHIFVSLHFYKYQYWLWTFSKQKKKKISHNDSDDSPPPILPYSIECSTILKPLRILPLTHFHQPLCHFNIYSLQATSSADIQCSFLEQKILKQLRECLQSYRLTQPRQAPVLIHQQLQARCMWNQLLAYSLKIFWTLFILCFPGFFPFLLRPLFLSCVFSISYSLLFPFSLHSLFHSIHMGFCFASCWLSFLFCILLPFHSRPLACNCFFFLVI